MMCVVCLITMSRLIGCYLIVFLIHIKTIWCACDTRCAGEPCYAGFSGTRCISTCEGVMCSAGCIGDNCISTCKGTKCSAGCTGENCRAVVSTLTARPRAPRSPDIRETRPGSSPSQFVAQVTEEKNK